MSNKTEKESDGAVLETQDWYWEESYVAWDQEIDGHTDSVTAVSKDKDILKGSDKSKDKEAGNKDGI